MTNSRQQEKLSLANIKPVRLIFLCVTLLSLSNCSEKKEVYRISGNIEDPQNEIANTIAVVLNKKLGDSVVVRPGIGSLANLDSLEKGVSDFGVVDNYSRYSSKVSSVIPLYSQVLHILHKRTLNPVTIKDLLYHRKVFAGIDGSGTNRFVRELINDFGIDVSTVEFVSVID